MFGKASSDLTGREANRARSNMKNERKIRWWRREAEFWAVQAFYTPNDVNVQQALRRTLREVLFLTTGVWR